MKDYWRNIIALASIKGIGAAFMKKNRPILLKYRDDLTLLSNFGGKVNPASLQAQLPHADQLLALCQQHELGLLTIADDWYPSLLLALKDPPPLLFYKGNLELIHHTVAIIGTRNATDLGNKIASRVGQYFKDHSAICNGLANGIDKSVFQDSAVLPKAIGVLGGGLLLDQTLSPMTAQLAKNILNANGLLLSEFLPDKVQDKFSAIKTCRIQAGIAKGLLLIQSPIDGGSKYTLRAFANLKRPLGFIAYPQHPEFATHQSFSANRLLQTGKEGLIKWTKIERPTPGQILPIAATKDYEQFLSELKTQ